MIPLCMCTMEEVHTIQRISGKEDIRQHLATLGFVIGSEVSIISNLNDNIIVSIKDGRIALDKTLANKIFV